MGDCLMGFLNSGGGYTPPGPTQEELDKQEAREKRADAQELTEKKKIASRQIARTKQGNRLLMTALPGTRETPQRTLGPSRNPRA